jgi:tetratricopeptide (TPR) repeat protein
LETDWGRLVDLIEWICVDLRSGNPSRTFERAWYVASAALAGRARARVWLLGEYAVLPHQPPPRRAPTPPKNPSPQHLIHALDRFPDDPELRLARIVAWTWGRDGEPYRNLTARATTFLTSRRSPAQPIKALETLVEDPSVGAEALVRIGQLHFAAADAAGALRAFELARPRAASPAVRYLASFLAGRALEALKRPAEAIEQYRRALEVLPDAESAAIALASLQFVGEDRDAAVALLNRAFASPAAEDDPGRLVGYGSYMHWPALRTAMRAELRR